MLLLASALIGLQGQTAVKKTLPNGAVLVSTQTERGGRFRLSLCLSAFCLPDKEGQAGTRHLLEHLVAKGQTKDLDRKLETVGCWLTADTDRDSLVFTVTGPASQVSAGFSALKDILGPLSTSKEELARELAILKQEQALHEPFRPFLDGAWDAAFGLASPFGDFDFLAKQSPESLAAAKVPAFSGIGATLSVEGDIDAPVCALRAQECLASLPKGSNPLKPREALPPAGTVVVRGQGAARAVPVGGIGDPMTPATVGVAVWLGRKLAGSEVVYDPSGWPGVVLVWSADPGQAQQINGLVAAFTAEAVRDARTYAVAWANGVNLEGPQQDRLKAKLAMQSPNQDLAKLTTQARGLTDEELVRAAMQWKTGYAYEIRGGK